MALQITDNLIEKLQFIHDNTVKEVCGEYYKKIDIDKFETYLVDFFIDDIKDFELPYILDSKIGEDEINTAFILKGNYSKYSKNELTVFLINNMSKDTNDILDNLPRVASTFLLKVVTENLDNQNIIVNDKAITDLINTKYELFKNNRE